VKSDAQLRLDVVEELKSALHAAARDIGVTVNDGIVTLTGNVASTAEKFAAEQAVRRMADFRVIADEIEVNTAADRQKRDKDVAEAVSHVFQTDTQVPTTVKALVENGWVTLTGQVPWEYQKDTAADAIGRLREVAGVDNQVDGE
jgi:osmotically-inducible protein OsmY